MEIKENNEKMTNMEIISLTIVLDRDIPSIFKRDQCLPFAISVC